MIVLMKVKRVEIDPNRNVKRYELEQDTFPEVGYFTLTPKEQEAKDEQDRLRRKVG